MLSVSVFFKLAAQSHFILNADSCKKYIDQFNKDDVELYKGYFPNDSTRLKRYLRQRSFDLQNEVMYLLR